MLNYVATLAQNIDTIVVCELHRGFALQCFHIQHNQYDFFQLGGACLLVIITQLIKSTEVHNHCQFIVLYRYMHLYNTLSSHATQLAM